MQHEYHPRILESVVDSTGAGDSFIGAFLAFFQSMTMDEAIKKSAAYAATTLKHHGSINQLLNR